MTALKDTMKIMTVAAIAAFAGFGAHADETRPPCRTLDISVYFQPGETELNPFSRALLERAVSRMDECEIARIEVSGYADASGDVASNLEISQARVDATLSFVMGKGIVANSIVLGATGDEDAIGPDGVTEVMHRKAELRIVPVGRSA